MIKFITDSLSKMFGTKKDRDLKLYTPRVSAIIEQYEQLTQLSNDELRQKTSEFREYIADYQKETREAMESLKASAEASDSFEEKEAAYAELDELSKELDKQLEEALSELLPEAFAVVKETARRFKENNKLEVTCTDHDRELAAHRSYVSIQGDKAIWSNEWEAAGGKIKWDMLHYDVQLIGGMVLHDGKIAEMATGEGKTLVATLPAYLNGLSGKGVHIITVNDYLARRDSEWVGPIFEFLMLTVDCIDKYQPHSEDRKRAYRCDIIYGTNNEFGFDYLRDNMVRSPEERVQGKHHYAMVDEVDSVLIDDARTPLIISGPVTQGRETLEYQELKPKVERLIAAQKKLATEFLAEAKQLIQEGKTGNKEGESGMALLRSYRAFPKNRPLIKYLSMEGNKAMLEKAENFYMQEQSKNMWMVDQELYFTIDEKNRQIDLTEKGTEFLSRGVEDSNFYILPDLTMEMVEIDKNESLDEDGKKEAKEELAQNYAIKTQRLHSINQLLKAYALFERDEEYVVLDGQVKIVDEQTGRIMEGRRYSDGLHQALEAKENVKIGDITQTYATITLQNYFRMYHKLAGMTGTAVTEANEFWQIYKLDVVEIPTNRPVTRKDMQDLVFKTEREKFNAVIDEIARLTEARRPVLVGTTSVEISEKVSRLLTMRKISHNVLNAKQHQREAQIVAEAGLPGKVTIATNMAGRGTDIKLSEEVKKAGGLAIIATERHDSRRVDRQLRGRAGRQGDPGSSQFYVSLEDKLMRLFHSERITKVMDRLGHKEGDVIQHPLISRSIERAQRKVEENNFGIRKRLLEYDDVMNIQREAIYKKRQNALSGERLSVDLHNMLLDTAATVVIANKQYGDFDGYKRDLLEYFAITTQLDEDGFKALKENEMIAAVQKEVTLSYRRKSEVVNKTLMPIIQRVYAAEGHKYKRIAIPFTDGRSKMLPIAAELKQAIDSGGKSIMQDIEKSVALSLIDELWKEHLRSMDELKESVQAASFEQKDPLVIYKEEAYYLFEVLVQNINREVTSFLMTGRLAIRDEQGVSEAREERSDFSRVRAGRGSYGASAEQRQRAAAIAAGGPPSKPETFKREQPKVGRNEPCPCGSGKKYKQCHGR